MKFRNERSCLQNKVNTIAVFLINHYKASGIFIFLFLYTFELYPQGDWKRVPSSGIPEIGDMLISNKNEYFVSLLNNSEIFISKDEGNSWSEVSNRNIKFRGGAQTKYLLNMGDEVSYSLGFGRGSYCIYRNDSFHLISTSSSSFQNMKCLNSGDCYFYTYFGVYNTDSNKLVDYNRPVCEIENISNFYLFSDEEAYIIASPINRSSIDTVIVYKLNISKKEYHLYSMITGKNLGTPIINKYGRIIVFNDGYKISNENNPELFDELILNTNSTLKDLVHLDLTSDNNFYILFKNELIINYAKSIKDNQWIKIYKLGSNLPIISSDFVHNIFRIKDSSNAIINLSTDCGYSELYLYSKNKQTWHKGKLPLFRNNWLDLKKDRDGNLFAYHSCNTNKERKYSISSDSGLTWQQIIINGEFVTCLGINNSGIPVAIANGNFFEFDSKLEVWNQFHTSIPIIPKIRYLSFFNTGPYFVLNGVLEKQGSNEKYIFVSRNNGLDWNISTSIDFVINDLPTLDVLTKQDGSLLLYSWDGALRLPLCSKDNGKSWNKDFDFSGFNTVYKISLTVDGRYIVDGDLGSSYGTFISDSTHSAFNLLSPYFENRSALTYSGLKNELFGHSQNDSDPFYSINLGQTVAEVGKGLSSYDVDSRYFTNTLFESLNSIILTVQFDGIYYLVKNLSSNVKNYTADNKDDLVNVIIKRYELCLFNLLNLTGKEQVCYSLFNSLGEVLESNVCIDVYDNLDFNYLASGVYYLTIKYDRDKSKTMRITKVN